MLSPSHVSPLEPHYPILPTLLLWVYSYSHPPIPSSLLWHSPTLGNQAFIEPRASPPTDVKQCHLLLHMQLESWVPPCILFGWWFSSWELWVIWLVNIIVLPMGLQTPSAPLGISLTHPLGSQCLVQWLAASICHCICQTLAEPLRRQL